MAEPWRRYLTPEERDYLWRSDLEARLIERSQQKWDNKFALERKRIVMRAMQRALYAKRKRDATGATSRGKTKSPRKDSNATKETPGARKGRRLTENEDR